MAFVTSATGSSTGFANSPLTISSVACGTAANTIVVGWINTNSSLDNSITNMTVNGSSSGVTAQTEGTVGFGDKARLFWWTGTGPGTVDIGFTWTPVADVSISSAGVLVWDGYSSLTNFAGAYTLGSTTTPSVTVTSATGDLAVGIFVHQETTQTGSPGSGVTERLDTTAGYSRHLAFEKAGAGGSTTVDGTTSGSIFPEARYAFSLVAASGGGSNVPLNILVPKQGIFLASSSGR